ncbi:hypothetical protein E2C01_028839 [Portunus trituberculatus]|uniref:Uncharacterized protein n=1 Tax=Portunus trituberculatus TaxID=210409 RepID=A0A5B7EQ69_PORTR|nr:hypothetical protein [Portunus trituberculatus]
MEDTGSDLDPRYKEDTGSDLDPRYILSCLEVMRITTTDTRSVTCSGKAKVEDRRQEEVGT